MALGHDGHTLPVGWRWVKLGDACNFESGTFLDRSKIRTCGEFPVYGANGVIGRTDSTNYEEPRIVIGRVGSCGAINVTAGPSWITDNTLVCSPQSELDFTYLASFLRSVDFDKLRSASIQPLLTQTTLKSISIPLPPLPEQKRIAAILTEKMAAVEKARAASEARLKAAKELPAAYLREVFESEEAQGWAREKIGVCCSIRGGKRLPQGHGYSKEPTNHPYLRVVDFERGTIRVNNLCYLAEETHKEISRYIISHNDVYISIAGTIGVAGTIPEELDGANLTENAARLIIRDNAVLSKVFLASYLQSQAGQADIALRTNKVGQPKLALERIASIEIPIPSLPEQKRQEKYLAAKHQTSALLCKLIEDELKAIKSLPAALLRQAFSGEL